MCCLSFGLEIILVFPLVKQAFSQKKLTHWINYNGKVLNSWPKWQVLFREHYINCNVYWLQTSGHTVYISSPDLYFTFLTLYVWCAAWWDLRMNTLTNLISFTLWSFLPFIEYYFKAYIHVLKSNIKDVFKFICLFLLILLKLNIQLNLSSF